MNTIIRVQTKISTGSKLKRPPGNYWIVKNDYDMVWKDFGNITKVSRNTRNGVPWTAESGRGVPATARFSDDTPFKFSYDLSWWLHELSCEKLPKDWTDKQKGAQFKSAWRGNAWMTNFAGSGTRRDYINGENLSADEMQGQPMATGGALLREVKVTDKELFFEAINPLGGYRAFHPSERPDLFYIPTISAREPIYDSTGRYIVGFDEFYQEPFDDYLTNYIVAIFGFIPISFGESSTGYANKISLDRVRKLGPTEPVPNPFICAGWTKENPYKDF